METENALIPHTSIRRVEADGVTVFYREAGLPDAPVVLLLHGFPTDNPNATVQFLDTGHFAFETHVEEIAFAMRNFLATFYTT